MAAWSDQYKALYILYLIRLPLDTTLCWYPIVPLFFRKPWHGSSFSACPDVVVLWGYHLLPSTCISSMSLTLPWYHPYTHLSNLSEPHINVANWLLDICYRHLLQASQTQPVQNRTHDHIWFSSYVLHFLWHPFRFSKLESQESWLTPLSFNLNNQTPSSAGFTPEIYFLKNPFSGFLSQNEILAHYFGIQGPQRPSSRLIPLCSVSTLQLYLEWMPEAACAHLTVSCVWDFLGCSDCCSLFLLHPLKLFIHRHSWIPILSLDASIAS